jgi:hypothetical protein
VTAGAPTSSHAVLAWRLGGHQPCLPAPAGSFVAGGPLRPGSTWPVTLDEWFPA